MTFFILFLGRSIYLIMTCFSYQCISLDIGHLGFVDHQLSYCYMETILGDPGADSGGKGKSKRAEKYGTKKSKERREEPLGTMSHQTSSKRSLPFWLLIGARKLLCFSAQSEASRPMGRFVYPYTE